MEPSESTLLVGEDVESDWKRTQAKLRDVDQQSIQGRNHKGEEGDEKYGFP